MQTSTLVDKYNIPVPRYTSYPTVPYWTEDMSSQEDWTQKIEQAIQLNKTDKGISLYLHLPFCEQLCTYCGCNKRITKNHNVEEVYIEYLLKEWSIYKQIFEKDLSINAIHLGGGTPTFFSPKNLVYLLKELLKEVKIQPDHEFSFEGHPNNTTKEHLQELYNIGFNRVSFGVQDLDIKVQRAINRIQPIKKVKQVTEWAREIGYTSVNYDLIYGLPFQTLETIKHTMDAVIELKPNRIAYYSYAHVPWVKKSQRAYDENDLPTGNDKYALYLLGQECLTNAGYSDVGMDHFALINDSLLTSKENGALHRNFMGYTTINTEFLLGLGVSAISDAFLGYRQNVKTVEEYYKKLDNDVLPIFKGINLSEEDILLRKHILNIACNGQTEWNNEMELTPLMIAQLTNLKADNLINWENNKIEVTPLGWSFLRNICAVFDKRMNKDTLLSTKVNPTFSSAV